MRRPVLRAWAKAAIALTVAAILLLTLTPANADAFAKQYFGRFRAELHERLSGPLYVLTFAMIAFAALGQARTTRQGRGTAIIAAIIIVLALRVAGIAASNLSARTASAVVLVYALPLGGLLGAFFYVFGRVPAWAQRLFTRSRSAGAQPV